LKFYFIACFSGHKNTPVFPQLTIFQRWIIKN